MLLRFEFVEALLEPAFEECHARFIAGEVGGRRRSWSERVLVDPAGFETDAQKAEE
nr:hypothetical protein [Mycobacterium eburneum]